MPIADASNDNRIREIMQAPWNKPILTLNQILLGILQLMYQGGVVSAFELHPTIVSSYVVVAAIYGFACICCEGQLLPSSMEDDRYLPVMKANVFLAGSLATRLLLMVVVPIFGWMVFIIGVMMCTVMALRVRAEIYALIRLAIVAALPLLNGFLPGDCVLPI